MAGATATFPDDAHARPFELLRLTWRLLARHWPALAFWFFAQQLAGMMLLRAATALGHVNHLLGFLGLAVVVVAQLLCTIAMFDALRSALPGLAAAGNGNGNALDAAPAPARFGAMLAVALLPFFAYYASWGLLDDSIRAYKLGYFFNGYVERDGLPTDLLQSRGLWLSLAATWLLRQWFVARHRERPSALWSVLSTICNAYWLFLGLYVIAHWSDAAVAWLDKRVFWTWFGASARVDAASVLVVAAPSLPTRAIGQIVPVIEALLLPLAWFAIAAIVLGRDPGRTAWMPGSGRVDAARQRFAALPLPLRHAVGKTIGTVTDGWNSKIVPVGASLRLLRDAGVRSALTLCVCYVALDVLCNLIWRGVVIMIGPHSIAAWRVIAEPLTTLFDAPLAFHASLLAEPVRICLLAAAVDLALRRVQRDAREDALSDAKNAGNAAARATT